MNILITNWILGSLFSDPDRTFLFSARCQLGHWDSAGDTWRITGLSGDLTVRTKGMNHNVNGLMGIVSLMCSYVFFGFWDQHFCRLGPMSNDLPCIFLRWRMSISIWWFPECGYHQIIQVIRPWLGIECYGFGVPTFWETSNLWQKRKQLNNKPTQTFLTLMRLFAPPRINWHHIAAWPSEPQKIPLSHLIK